MAKRFTDSEKWQDAWFMDLPSKYKLFWLFLCDQCDHAGVWKVNFKVAAFYVGEHLEPSEVKRFLKERVEFISDEYWYLTKFIKFQYKVEVSNLNPKNNTHLSAIKILHQFERFKPLTSPLLGANEGVKDKDKDNVKNKDKTNVPTLSEVVEYFRENGYTESAATKAFNYYEEDRLDRNGRVWKDSNGKTVKSWKQKMRGVWFKDENKVQQQGPIIGTF